MMLKNVVIVANRASIAGGAEKVACETAALCARHGLQTILLAAEGPVAPELDAAGVKTVLLNQGYISQEGVGKTKAALQGLWNGRAARALSDILADLDPNRTVVNIHSWTHTMSASILALVARADVPLVITAHDYFLACPNGGFYDFMQGRPCPFGHVCPGCVRCNCDKRSYAQKLYRLARFCLQTRILKSMPHRPGVVFLSDFSERMLVRSIPFGYDSYRVDNPISLKASPYAPGFDGRDVDCLFVGRLDSEKDCALFCRVVTAAGARALVLGDGAQRRDLEKRFGDIEFAGKVDADIVERACRRSKMLVFTSSCYEVAPLVAREAQMAGGLPVIARGGTAIESFIRDGVDGFISPHDDEGALVENIRRALDPSVNNSLRAGVAAIDVSPHDPEVYFARMRDIYERHLNRGCVDER